MIDANIDMTVNIAGVTLKNPVIAASGTFAFGREYARFFDLSRLGGICVKGLTMSPRKGNAGVRLWETPGGLLNSIGLENPGIPAFIANELPSLKKSGVVIIANLSGSDMEEYVKGAELLNKSDVDMIELNISCPNVKAGGMAFGLEPEIAGNLTSRVRGAAKDKPLIVKLSPNAPSVSAVALSCVKEGTDALSLVNTFKAMAIDTVNRKPVFDNITAGLSGPAIKPIALRMVWELYDALIDAKARAPIIGVGGIENVSGALEFLMAGAAAIQVGSATFVNPLAMVEIIDALRDYMTVNNISKIDDISIRRR